MSGIRREKLARLICAGIATLALAGSAKATLVNSNTVVEDEIEYYVQTDKSVYDLEEDVAMLFRVTNLSDDDVEFIFSYGPTDNTCNWMVDKDELRIWDNLGRAATTAVSSFSLSPSESFEYTQTWNMTYKNGDDILPGNYNVTGVLGYHPDHDRYVPVSVEITILSEPRCGDANHPYPVGDLNQDCRVNLLDLAILASHWLEDNTPVSAVTTTYLFEVDPNALRTSGGFAGQGQGSCSIGGWFELTIDFDAGTAWFNSVDATFSKKIYLSCNPIDCRDSLHWTESLDVLFTMTELVSTSVSDLQIDFVFVRNIPKFPGGANTYLTVIFGDDSVHLVGSYCEPVSDGYYYHLDVVAVPEPAASVFGRSERAGVRP